MDKIMICRNCKYYYKNGKNDLCDVLTVGRIRVDCERVRTSYEQCGCFEMKSPNGRHQAYMRQLLIQSAWPMLL